MRSLLDEIRYGFLQRYKAVGQIIVINVGAYLVLAVAGVVSFFAGEFAPFYEGYRHYLGLPADLIQLAQRPWTPLTYLFTHEVNDPFHVLFNMLLFFWIGRIYLEYLGSRKVWSTFLLGALAGGFVFVLTYNVFPVFQGLVGDSTLIGASAGVLAVVIATATLLPNYTIGLLFFGPVKLKWVALVMVVLDFLSIPHHNPGGMLAHLGGAAFGLGYIQLQRRGVNLAAPFDTMVESLKSHNNPSARKLKVVAPKAHKATTTLVGKPSQQEIDRILDKIKAVGYEKLSKEEKQSLFNFGKD